MKTKGWVATAVCVVLLGLPVQEARAQWVVSVPVLEEMTWAMKVQQVLQYIREAQTALKSIQMAQMMVREGINLAQHPSTNILADLNMLSGIITQSQGLAGNLAQLDASFRMTYGNYSGPDAASTFAMQYGDWTAKTLNTICGAVNAAGYQGSMLGNEQAWMQQIQQMNQTPMGHDASLQLGNTIAIEEIAQLEKLRQLMIADMTSKGAFTAQLVNQQQATQSAQQNGFAHAPWTADTRRW